jgi:hypothetical protein
MPLSVQASRNVSSVQSIFSLDLSAWESMAEVYAPYKHGPC